MLTKIERYVMKYLYLQCQKKGTCLLSALDISDGIFPKYDLTEVEIENIINNLILENYITVVNSDKKGRNYYCITLSSKGESFQRELENKRKSTRLLIIRTILLACLSFVVGLILKAIFIP